MLPVTELISRIRTITHDTQKLKYTDECILECINGAIRFFRRMIKDYKPALIVENPIIGILPEGESRIELGFIPTKYLDVRIDGKRILPIHFANITDFERRETPFAYYQTGMQTLNFYPVPIKNVTYRILAVGDHREIDIDGKSPYPNDFDDFLIEYAVIRLSVGDEFNMSEETQLMGEIYDQVKQNLIGSEPQINFVDGYFDPPNSDFDCVRGS